MPRDNPWSRFDRERAYQVFNDFRAYQEKRCTTQGNVVLALANGDTNALQTVALSILQELANDGAVSADARAFLEIVLQDIASGRSPNEAFGYVRSGEKGPRPRVEDREMRELDAALSVASLVSADVSSTDAKGQVADRLNMGEPTVARAYHKFFPKRK